MLLKPSRSRIEVNQLKFFLFLFFFFFFIFLEKQNLCSFLYLLVNQILSTRMVSEVASVLVKENKLFVSLLALCYNTGIGVAKI